MKVKRTKLEIYQDSLDIWQSYYDQIEMTDEDKVRLDELDAENSELIKAEEAR